MPVSFSVASHPAESVRLRPNIETGLTPQDILAKTAKEYQRGVELLQFSLTGEDGSGRDFTTKLSRLIPRKNGFVDTVITAYNAHHALVIRPDDVWLAILSQFNLYVNAHAELLRAKFVAHDGRPELKIVNVGTRFSLDFGSMARQMIALVDAHIVDSSLRSWALPAFSTTTTTDTTAACVLLMSTLKEYFAYKFVGVRCGIPRVTLAGEKADWEDILGRLEKLREYGLETIAWYHLLHPVLVRFVAAFDSPVSPENVDFWGRVVHSHRRCGPAYYSGWINAFMAFGANGEWLGHALDTTVNATAAPELMNAETFWATYLQGLDHLKVKDKDDNLVFDGTPYHHTNSKKISPGYANVDVTLDDNGARFDCAMVAGVVGTRVSSSGPGGDSNLEEEAEEEEEGSGNGEGVGKGKRKRRGKGRAKQKARRKGKDDTVSPVAGWWIFIKKE
ncbi:hypothetical protein B0H19DRAFT_1201115 [Mycena capillaripes]|nr:hypothetical protein B0H19DRAFT_1201115 [Mycena capillaripes]